MARVGDHGVGGKVPKDGLLAAKLKTEPYRPAQCPGLLRQPCANWTSQALWLRPTRLWLYRPFSLIVSRRRRSANFFHLAAVRTEVAYALTQAKIPAASESARTLPKSQGATTLDDRAFSVANIGLPNCTGQLISFVPGSKVLNPRYKLPWHHTVSHERLRQSQMTLGGLDATRQLA